MIQDANLQFDPAGTAITTTAVSTNVLDLGVNRDMGVGDSQLKLLCTVGTSFASATPGATLNVQLLGAPDNGSGAPGAYSVLGESGVLPLGRLTAGQKIAQLDVPVVLNQLAPVLTTTGSASSASTALTVASTTNLVQGLYAVGAGIVPGTTIASIAGSVVTLSQNTSAVIPAGQTVSFSPNIPVPRFLELNYVCSNTMTAGTVQASLVIGRDDQAYYPPGFTQPY